MLHDSNKFSRFDRVPRRGLQQGGNTLLGILVEGSWVANYSTVYRSARSTAGILHCLITGDANGSRGLIRERQRVFSRARVSIKSSVINVHREGTVASRYLINEHLSRSKQVSVVVRDGAGFALISIRRVSLENDFFVTIKHYPIHLVKV